MTRRASRSFLLSSRMALAVFGVALALAGVMCGGTTGQEGLQLGSGLDGAAPGEAAGPDMDSGAFDVVIDYTTRTLPDVVAPPDTGAEGGYPWPSCPPFIPVRPERQSRGSGDGGQRDSGDLQRRRRQRRSPRARRERVRDLRVAGEPGGRPVLHVGYQSVFLSSLAPLQLVLGCRGSGIGCGRAALRPLFEPLHLRARHRVRTGDEVSARWVSMRERICSGLHSRRGGSLRRGGARRAPGHVGDESDFGEL